MIHILDLRPDSVKQTFGGSKQLIGYKYFVFKGGEPHIKIDHFYFQPGDYVKIITRLTSMDALGKLMVANNALQRMLFDMGNSDGIFLQCEYFPGARQDRLMVDGEPFTVKIYADIINAMNFKRVMIKDAHSGVTPALLNNCINKNNHAFAFKALKDIGEDNVWLISPDAGSNKKIDDLAKYINEFRPIDIVKCDKTRDVSTGAITNFEVYKKDLKGRPCLIVDDICDGGGTFLGLAKILKEHGAGKIYLAVTHGIFSAGFKHLNATFEMVYTTNSFKEYDKTWHEAHKHHKGFKAKLTQIMD